MIGGMRGTTWTQAVQFLVLLVGLLWLAATVLADGFDYPASVGELGDAPLRNPAQTVGDGWEIRDAPNLANPGEPTSFSQPGARYGSVGQFALVVTLILGTAGLPHVMNRFFTSPSGRAARSTTVWVLALAGMFYALAVLLGTAARALIPAAAARYEWLAALTVDGVLRIPEHALLALGRIYGGTAGLGVVRDGSIPRDPRHDRRPAARLRGVVGSRHLRAAHQPRGDPTPGVARRAGSRPGGCARRDDARLEPQPRAPVTRVPVDRRADGHVGRSRSPARRLRRCSSWRSGGRGLPRQERSPGWRSARPPRSRSS